MDSIRKLLTMSSLKQLKIATFFALITPMMMAQGRMECYKVTRVADKITTILETVTNGNVNIYIVEGKDSALIIDTGYGTGDIVGYIKTLTKLPLIVVNTHGHRDHVGGDSQFSKVFLHPDDFYMVDTRSNKDAADKHNGKTNPVEDKPVIVGTTTFVPVREGHVFDLGGRKLEVIVVPGHTHGSIVILDKENKILFAGDNTNSIVWLFLKDCYPLEVYLKSLEKVEKLSNHYNIVMPGHNTPLDKAFISDQVGAVKSILDGTCTPFHYNHPFNTFGALEYDYKTAKVAYDPNNLRVKK